MPTYETADFIAPNVSKFDDFTKGYLACLLWTEGEVEKRKRLPSKSGLLDSGDCSDDMLIAIYEDCKAFQEENCELLDAAHELYGYEYEQAGHDYWLTRNGHGAGFWDRGIEEIGEKLSNAARAKGERYVYVYKKRLCID